MFTDLFGGHVIASYQKDVTVLILKKQTAEGWFTMKGV